MEQPKLSLILIDILFLGLLSLYVFAGKDAVPFHGDESTFPILTKPWRDDAGKWQPPLSARTEWLHHLYPRAYRLGVSVNL